MYNLDKKSKTELAEIIRTHQSACAHRDAVSPEIISAADRLRRQHYGSAVYMRGLIEFTNYCKNNCCYCGIRKENPAARRYRLTEDEILSCCESGYALGFRTFVLQGGEDSWYTESRMCGIIEKIRRKYPDCAITLSIGEKPAGTYRRYFEAGADRYLLRHETASKALYEKLHPHSMSFENRRECLYALKEIGFQVGAGFMVGSPFQTEDDLAEDLIFIRELKPHMVGIGPFIPAAETPFAGYGQGSLSLTLLMLALTRILLPDVLLPATTALGSIHPQGREMGLEAGCNVVMPNLSPSAVRKDYALYDNKVSTGDEAAESLLNIESRIRDAGFEVSMGRGDHAGFRDGDARHP